MQNRQGEARTAASLVVLWGSDRRWVSARHWDVRIAHSGNSVRRWAAFSTETSANATSRSSPPVRRGSPARPIRQRRRCRRSWLLRQASDSQVRLQVTANRAASKHIAVSAATESRAAAASVTAPGRSRARGCARLANTRCLVVTHAQTRFDARSGDAAAKGDVYVARGRSLVRPAAPPVSATASWPD